MIDNTVVRNNQVDKRILLRDSSETFANLISEGTSCSKFEAGVITEKAHEVFRLGAYSDDSALQPGQMIWKAIVADEPPGKPLSECVFKTVRLTVHLISEDREVKNQYGATAKRGQQLMRLCTEAFEQGALLTQEDLAEILGCDVRTIRNDQQRFQKRYGLLVPTRGNKCDIGPGITHREKVISMFIDGMEAINIARNLQHSLKAVERYISSFCRIVYCQQQLRNSLKTAMVVGCSVHQVNICLDIHREHCAKSRYKEILEKVERVGSAFWEVQDGKKKPGQMKRRSK
jgi:hypothetical protein